MKWLIWASLLVTLGACSKQNSPSEPNDTGNVNTFEQSAEEIQQELQDQLISATYANDHQAVTLLLQQGVDTQSEAVEQMLPVAVKNNYSDIALSLIKQGVAIKVAEYETPLLIIAATHNNLKLVDALLSASADIEAADSLGTTAIMVGNKEVMHHLIKQGANPLIVSQDGNSALRQATLNNDISLVKDLISQGADLNGCFSGCVSPPLIVAATLEETAIAKALLEAGANANVVTSDGRNPVTTAASYGSLEMVKFLMNKGVPAQIKGFRGGTALDKAITSGHVAIAKYLHKQGVKLNSGMYFQSHLLTAAQANNLEMVKYLLSLGFDINEVSSESKTAIIHAIENNEFELAKTLHKLGARFSAGSQSLPAVIFYFDAESIDLLEYIYKVEPNVFKQHRAAALAGALATKDPTFLEFLTKRKLFPNKPVNAKASENLLQGMAIGFDHFPDEVFIRIFKSKILTFTSNIANINLLGIISKAIEDDRPKVLRAMGDNGVPILYSVPPFKTPLLEAINHDKYDSFTYLIDKGADIDLPVGWDKTTPLNFAAKLGRTQLIKSLLSKNARIAIVNDDGENDLQTASEDCETHDLLLEAYMKNSISPQLTKPRIDWLKRECSSHSSVAQYLSAEDKQ